jgi:hypothetical protein
MLTPTNYAPARLRTVLFWNNSRDHKYSITLVNPVVQKRTHIIRMACKAYERSKLMSGEQRQQKVEEVVRKVKAVIVPRLTNRESWTRAKFRPPDIGPEIP